MTDDVVRTITIKGTTDGVDQATEAVNKLGDAMAGVTVTSDTTSKSTLSVQSALDRQQRSLDTTYRSQVNYNQSVGIINKGLNEGLISQDRANQLIDLARDRFDKATASATPFMAALNGVQTQLVALAAGAGPVGVFLASFGPWGLAAAAGIGIVTMGFSALADAATQLAQKAQGLQTFSLITGLTTDQIQKLEEEGSKFGIQTDTVGKFLDQFSVKLTTARTAMGPYYDMVRQINPALAQQTLTTQGEADQLVILAAAYAQAGEKGNALLQAAGGRGAVQVAPLLGTINSAGSVGNLPASPQISADEIARMTKELNANSIAWDHIKTNVGAIGFNLGFSDDRRKTREDLEAITAAVRDFSPSQAWNDFVAGFARMIGAGSVSAANFKPPAVPVIPVQSGGNLPAATGAQQTGLTPEQQANVLKTTVAALGSAATAQDQYNVKIAEATIARGKNILSETEFQRVIGSAGLEEAIAILSLHNSALGAAATVTDIVTQKTAALQQEQQKGAGLSATEYANAQRLIKAQADGTFALQGQIDAIKVQAGAIGMSVGAAETFTIVQTKINANLNAGKSALDGINPAFLKLADAAGAAKQGQAQLAAQQTADFSLQTSLMTGLESQIAAVQHQLHGNDWQAFMNDGLSATMRLADGMKQLSATAQSALGGMATDMRVGLQSGKTAWESFQTAAVNALNKISDKLMQMAIDSLWSKAFGGASTSGLGGILGALGMGGASSNLAASNAAATGAPAGDLAFAFSAGGMVGINGTPTYVHPAYFDNAPHMASGGQITDGGVPIIAHRNERILNAAETAKYNAGGGASNIAISVSVDVSGANGDKAVNDIAEAAASRGVSAALKQVPNISVNSIVDATNRGLRLHA